MNEKKKITLELSCTINTIPQKHLNAVECT